MGSDRGQVYQGQLIELIRRESSRDMREELGEPLPSHKRASIVRKDYTFGLKKKKNYLRSPYFIISKKRKKAEIIAVSRREESIRKKRIELSNKGDNGVEKNT